MQEAALWIVVVYYDVTEVCLFRDMYIFVRNINSMDVLGRSTVLVRSMMMCLLETRDIPVRSMGILSVGEWLTNKVYGIDLTTKFLIGYSIETGNY